MPAPIYPELADINGEVRMTEHPALKRTNAERAAGVTPVNYAYVPSPRIDPRRYGVIGDGVTDDTAAFQTAVNIAYATKGRLLLPDNFNILTSGVSLTMSGNHTNEAFSIEGASMNSSCITQIGNPSDGLIYIEGATPEGNPQEAQLVLENLTVTGVGRTCAGILLNNLASFRISNVRASEFLHGLFLRATLIGCVDQNCQFHDCDNGVYARPNTSDVGPNLVTIRDCRFYGNTSWGLDYGGGDRLKVVGCDFEVNGTESEPATGAVIIRDTVSEATGYASIDFDGNWFERNYGWGVLVESTSNLYLAFRNCISYAEEDAQTLKVLGCSHISIEDFMAPSGAGSTFDLTASYAFIKNSIVGTLVDSGVTYPTYVNLLLSSTNFRNGRRDSFTATLTGVSGTAPTGSVTVYQQGDEITLSFLSEITGPSTSTSCTLSGLPTKYRPLNDTIGVVMTQDNGANSARPCLVAASTGVITLGYGQTMTSGGSKGIVGGEIRFRRP
jgi:hypothetical protein